MRIPSALAIFAAAACLGMFAGANAAQAGAIVAPSGTASTEGTTAGNLFGFGTSGQQLLFDISSTDFSSLSAADQITGFAFRVDTNLCGTCGAFGPTTLNNTTIQLATTSISPATSNGTYADYLTTNVQTVLSGNVTVSSAGNALASGPQAFDIIFTFTTPYTYSPASGNLVLYITINSADFIPDFIDAQAGPSDMSEYFGCLVCSGSATGNGNSNVMIVEFLTAPSGIQEVPEPSTLLVVISGLVGLMVASALARRPGRRIVS